MRREREEMKEARREWTENINIVVAVYNAWSFGALASQPLGP